MNDISKLKSIYFLGIGGIGMSALARYFHRRGVKVTGYDKTPSPLTDMLINEGIDIHFEDNPCLIPNDISLAVITPAIPKNMQELTFLQQKKIQILKRAQLLGLICKNKHTYAIAGTHGKTSTTAILAHILQGNKPITAFIGGIACNYNSNNIDDIFSDTIVVEADEYDRSFLNLFPNIAVITSMDADHLDIYGDEKALANSFNDFANQINKDGYLITKPYLLEKIKPSCKTITYGLNDISCNYYAKNITIKNGVQYFDIQCIDKEIKQIAFQVAGLHNIENAIAAVAVADLINIDTTIIKQQLSTFSGVKRRFEYIIKRDDFVYIDDYAHHPKEIDACIASAKKMHPNKQICGIFQPHLFTRTRDFADEFARSLSCLDTVILLEIYPAREKPIEGIDAQFLLNKITCKNKLILSKSDLVDYLFKHQPEILITMGAGDIDRLVDKIKERFA